MGRLWPISPAAAVSGRWSFSGLRFSRWAIVRSSSSRWRKRRASSSGARSDLGSPGDSSHVEPDLSGAHALPPCCSCMNRSRVSTAIALRLLEHHVRVHLVGRDRTDHRKTHQRLVVLLGDMNDGGRPSPGDAGIVVHPREEVCECFQERGVVHSLGLHGGRDRSGHRAGASPPRTNGRPATRPLV